MWNIKINIKMEVKSIVTLEIKKTVEMKILFCK